VSQKSTKTLLAMVSMNENNFYTGVAQIYLFVFTIDELTLQHHIEHIKNINLKHLLHPVSLEGGGEGGLQPPTSLWSGGWGWPARHPFNFCFCFFY
jgi:hypothetical protein